MLDCLGWFLVWLGCEPVAAVVRLRWLGPVAKMGGVVSWFPSNGFCGCCPCSCLAGGFASLGGVFLRLRWFVAVALAAPRLASLVVLS